MIPNLANIFTMNTLRIYYFFLIFTKQVLEMVSKIKRIKKDVTKFVFDITPLVIFDTKASEEHEVEMASFRNVGTGGHRGHVPSQIFQRDKSAFFCDEKCPFCSN